MAVEAIDDLQQEPDGFGVAPSDAVRGEAQSRRQAGHLHPLVVRPVVAATRSRRGADDLPQPLPRKALFGRDVGVTSAVLQASKNRCKRNARAAGERAERLRRGEGASVMCYLSET